MLIKCVVFFFLLLLFLLLLVLFFPTALKNKGKSVFSTLFLIQVESKVMHVVVSHELPWIYINVIVSKIYFCELKGIAEKQRGIKGCTHTFSVLY